MDLVRHRRRRQPVVAPADDERRRLDLVQARQRVVPPERALDDPLRVVADDRPVDSPPRIRPRSGLSGGWFHGSTHSRSGTTRATSSWYSGSSERTPRSRSRQICSHSCGNRRRSSALTPSMFVRCQLAAEIWALLNTSRRTAAGCPARTRPPGSPPKRADQVDASRPRCRERRRCRPRRARSCTRCPQAAGRSDHSPL